MRWPSRLSELAGLYTNFPMNFITASSRDVCDHCEQVYEVKDVHFCPTEFRGITKEEFRFLGEERWIGSNSYFWPTDVEAFLTDSRKRVLEVARVPPSPTKIHHASTSTTLLVLYLGASVPCSSPSPRRSCGEFRDLEFHNLKMLDFCLCDTCKPLLTFRSSLPYARVIRSVEELNRYVPEATKCTLRNLAAVGFPAQYMAAT